MQRINSRTVDLTDTEIAVHEWFQQHLDRGLGIPKAALWALRQGKTRFGRRAMTPEFVEYLSEGTVEWASGRLSIKAEWAV